MNEEILKKKFKVITLADLINDVKFSVEPYCIRLHEPLAISLKKEKHVKVYSKAKIYVCGSNLDEDKQKMYLESIDNIHTGAITIGESDKPWLNIEKHQMESIINYNNHLMTNLTEALCEIGGSVLTLKNTEDLLLD